MANAPYRTRGAQSRTATTILRVFTRVGVFGLGIACLLVQLAQGQDYQTYNLQHTQAAQIQAALLKLLPEKTEVVADQKSNRLLIRGPASVQQLAQSTIESLDQPNSPKLEGGEPILRSYTPPNGDVAATAEWLRHQFASLPDVRIASDQRTGQILVLAPAGLQEQIVQRLRQAPTSSASAPTAQSLNLPAQNAPVVPAQAQVQNAPAEQAPAQAQKPQAQVQISASGNGSNMPVVTPTGVHVLDLRNQTAAELEATLRTALGTHMAPIQNLPPDQTGYHITMGTTGEVDLFLDHQNQRAGVRGPGMATDLFMRVVRLLDATPGEQSTQILGLKNSKQSDVRRAIEAIRLSSPTADGADAVAKAAGTRSGASLAMMFQDSNKEESSEVPAQTVSHGGRHAKDSDEQKISESPSLIGPVQIELIDGLDVLIVRGHQRDVAQVNRIIEQIEQLSAETEPAVEIYYMQYTDGDAMSTLVSQVYQEVFSPRHGNVTILPLIKPNAILLVGRPENVKTAIDLVKRLDQPVAPETQFKVFALKNASASLTESVVEDFFSARGSLGTRARVTPDVRSNSLIIQASPRDLAEVGELISHIDNSTSKAVSEVRVFQLQNSLATDVAATLQAAIFGQTQSAYGGSGLSSRPSGSYGSTGYPSSSSSRLPTSGSSYGGYGGSTSSRPTSSSSYGGTSTRSSSGSSSSRPSFGSPSTSSGTSRSPQ